MHPTFTCVIFAGAVRVRVAWKNGQMLCAIETFRNAEPFRMSHRIEIKKKKKKKKKQRKKRKREKKENK